MNYFSAPGVMSPKVISQMDLLKSTPYEIIDEVCKYAGISSAELRSPSRKEALCIARHICVYLIKSKFKYRYALREVSIMLGRVNHATALHSLRVVENMMQTDVIFKRDVETLKIKFKIY